MFNGLNTFPAYRQVGLLSNLKSKINLGAILTNTQKTLNIVNQAIPLVYQVKPMIENAKTIFKVMGAVKEESTEPTRNINSNIKETNNKNSRNVNKSKDKSEFKENKTLSNNPVFFI